MQSKTEIGVVVDVKQARTGVRRRARKICAETMDIYWAEFAKVRQMRKNAERLLAEAQEIKAEARRQLDETNLPFGPHEEFAIREPGPQAILETTHGQFLQGDPTSLSLLGRRASSLPVGKRIQPCPDSPKRRTRATSRLRC